MVTISGAACLYVYSILVATAHAVAGLAKKLCLVAIIVLGFSTCVIRSGTEQSVLFRLIITTPRSDFLHV